LIVERVAIDVSEMDVEQLKALRGKIDAILDGPGDKIGDLDSAVAEMKAMRIKVAETGKAAVSKAIKAFLAGHPEVESIRWRQYTPYFNDGDACEFSVRGIYVKLVGADEDGGDYEDGYEDEYGLDKEKHAQLRSDMTQLDALFDSAEDTMKVTFGDHVQVTVGRDGEAEVEEYSHD
jgi:hypothetical protein